MVSGGGLTGVGRHGRRRRVAERAPSPLAGHQVDGAAEHEGLLGRTDAVLDVELGHPAVARLRPGVDPGLQVADGGDARSQEPALSPLPVGGGEGLLAAPPPLALRGQESEGAGELPAAHQLDEEHLGEGGVARRPPGATPAALVVGEQVPDAIAQRPGTGGALGLHQRQGGVGPPHPVGARARVHRGAQDRLGPVSTGRRPPRVIRRAPASGHPAERLAPSHAGLSILAARHPRETAGTAPEAGGPMSRAPTIRAMPGARILIAEDEGPVAAPLVAALRERGHQVRWVRAVRDVRSQLPEFQPQLLLLDVSLDTDGLELLQALRFAPLCPPAGVLVLIEPGDTGARDRAHQLGAAAVLAKEPSPTRVVQTVEDLLAWI